MSKGEMRRRDLDFARLETRRGNFNYPKEGAPLLSNMVQHCHLSGLIAHPPTPEGECNYPGIDRWAADNNAVAPRIICRLICSWVLFGFHPYG